MLAEIFSGCFYDNISIHTLFCLGERLNEYIDVVFDSQDQKHLFQLKCYG